MKKWLTGVALVATLLTFPFSAGARGDDIAEVASFRGNGIPLNWLAISPDGTRIAAVAGNPTVGKTGKNAQGPGEVTLWDVGGGTQVSSIKAAETDFTYVDFSANGKSLLTVHKGVGRPDGMAKLPIRLGARSGSIYQVWDVATGKPIGDPISPPPSGEFTTAVLSPDGRYLATVYNEQVTALNTPTKPFQVREVTVWDPANRKVAWRLPSVVHKGRVTWADSLAFSPDGSRLALYMSGSGGPTADRANGRPDRPQDSFKSLRMLSLESGEEAPRVAYEKTGLGIGSIMWTSGGRSLIVRNDRAFEKLESAGGEPEGPSALPWPQDGAAGPQEKTKGRSSARKVPTSLINPSRQPMNWFETFVTLSADGTRAAAHHYHDPGGRAPRENYAVIWDVENSSVLGTLRLADEPFATSGDAKRPAGYYDASRTAVRIALSGDGKKLAVGDLVGAVRVYDVSEISGSVAVKPGLPQPGNAQPSPDEHVKAIRQSYEEAAARARENLIKVLDQSIEILGMNAAKSGKPSKSLERHKSEKEAFEKDGLIPWSDSMLDYTGKYLRDLGAARAKVLASLGSSPMPDDLRQLIDDRVIARWTHQPWGRPESSHAFYSNGKMDDPASGDEWSFANRRLTLRWKDPNAPGGYWVDTCYIAADGMSYSGTNQNKTKIIGRLLKD